MTINLKNILSPEEFKDLETNSVICNYVKGQTLFVQDTPAYGVFEVLQGKFKISNTNAQGMETILFFRKEEEVIGLDSLFDERLYNVTATALEQTKVRYIRKSYFLDMISRNHELMMAVTKVFAQQYSELITMIEGQKTLCARDKVRTAIVDLNKKFKHNDRIDLNITREEWANYCGMSTETFIRFLTELRSDNVVNSQGRYLSLVG